MSDASQPNFHIQTSLPRRPAGPAQDPEQLAHLEENVKAENLMRRFTLVGVCFLGVIVISGLSVLSLFAVGFLGLLAWLLVLLFYCWMLFAFLHYRHGRQEELWQVISAAVEAEAPLPQALRAYLRDRPRGVGRQIWTAVLLWFVFPGYYWVWYIWNNYDRKVTRLSFLLEQGVPLPQALLLTPGVAPRETILAAAVGEVTGQTAQCLKQAARRLPTALWFELVPQLLYPLALLVYLTGTLMFWSLAILPKMQKICKDFKQPLPWLTSAVAGTGPTLVTGLWLFAALNVLLIIVQLFSSTVRWYFPIIGWIYRRGWQGCVLRLLGVLLETGKPALASVRLLSQAGSVPPVVMQRLDAVADDLEEGKELGPSLHKHGLLPAALLPLLQAAERSHNLPRTLGELGEHLSQRPMRFLRWFSQVVALLALLAIGVLVALFAASMVLPLVSIMETEVSKQ